MDKDANMNKPLWEALAKAHEQSEFYDLPGFIKNGNSLPEVDMQLLGDVEGKRILHLQCHIGTESISLAKKGALVTAVDFSERAIQVAQNLASQLNVNVEFINCNVYELDQVDMKHKFDVVYSSYGVVSWLYNLELWAQLIHNQLRQGGQFVLVEFHPIMFTFDEPGKIIYNYGSGKEPEIYEMEQSYTGDPLDKPYPEYCWNHSVSQVISALLKSNLKLTDYQEYDYASHPCFNEIVEYEPGKYRLKAFENISFPYVFSTVFNK